MYMKIQVYCIQIQIIGDLEICDWLSLGQAKRLAIAGCGRNVSVVVNNILPKLLSSGYRIVNLLPV